MSFFSERQPPLFDTKKRLGNLQSASSTERVQQQSEEVESQSGLTESWVELAPSRASLCSSVEAVMVDQDQGTNGGTNKDSRLSPVSIQSPHYVELESNFDQVKYQLVKDMLPPGKSTDWIWDDWSSRPENVASNRFFRNRNGQIGSALTTPPNSPEPDLSSDFEFKHRGKSKKWVFYRFEVIIGLFVSNVVTFLIGASIGYWFCKKITRSEDTY